MTIKCNRCGRKNLHWKHISGKWRLFKDSGDMHQCGDKPSPERIKMIDWNRVADVREGKIKENEHGPGKTTTMLINVLDYIDKTGEKEILVVFSGLMLCGHFKKVMYNLVEEIEGFYITGESKNMLEVNNSKVSFVTSASFPRGTDYKVFVDHGVEEEADVQI